MTDERLEELYKAASIRHPDGPAPALTVAELRVLVQATIFARHLTREAAKDGAVC